MLKPRGGNERGDGRGSFCAPFSDVIVKFQFRCKPVKDICFLKLYFPAETAESMSAFWRFVIGKYEAVSDGITKTDSHML